MKWLKLAYLIPTMLPVYHKRFNTVLNLRTVPKNWCNGLTTSIFKSGVRNDPSNYRWICVSSYLGNLFFSILNQRLLEHVTSLNTLHKSQIGFLPKNRTSDHLLTLRIGMSQTRSFSYSWGVNQGCILSPLLFN